MTTSRTRSPWRISKRLCTGVVCLCVAWVIFEIAVWPDVAAIAGTVPERTAFMRRYEARYERPVRVQWAGYGAISDHLKRAVLVAEDIDFFSHDGFATEELRVALREAVESRSLPRGASTITQQLAKNLWLSPSRSPRRKLREALLTRALERHVDKRRILEVYLNVVEFGDGTFGCEAASRHFFGKSAAGLTPHEAARMAAVLPRPSSWQPDGDSAGYLAAVRRIEARMARASWLAKVI